MKKRFDVFYDEDKELFYCYLDDEWNNLITSQFFIDILIEIAKMYDYVAIDIYSESHYRIVLEDALGIVINTHFDY